MADKPVVIEYKDGRTYVVRSAADAQRAHPDAKIIGYESGESYHAPKADKPEKGKAD